MVTKTRGIQETANAIVVDGKAEAAPKKSSPDKTVLLQEILQLNGVLGYILKDDATATVNLKAPEKKVEYALLASQAFDAAREMQELFGLGEVESTLVDCAAMKVLCLAVGGCTVSVFMEKTANTEEIAVTCHW
ncbi:MAG: roadblock/LC7 domain-containing protein [Candidatus Bathyarchaeota archaeon]|nr:roadblock/LC7 domain-containing protein [Candidatus Bathyarchaeota archaeon]